MIFFCVLVIQTHTEYVVCKCVEWDTIGLLLEKQNECETQSIISNLYRAKLSTQSVRGVKYWTLITMRLVNAHTHVCPHIPTSLLFITKATITRIQIYPGEIRAVSVCQYLQNDTEIFCSNNEFEHMQSNADFNCDTTPAISICHSHTKANIHAYTSRTHSIISITALSIYMRVWRLRDNNPRFHCWTYRRTLWSPLTAT